MNPAPEFPMKSKRLKKWAEDFADWCEMGFPVSGIGAMVSEEAGGRAVNVAGSIIAATTHPLLIFPDGGGIRIVYGTIGGIVPDGMQPGDSPTFILSGMTGSGVVYGGVDTDSGIPAPITASIAFAASKPADVDPNGDGTDGNFYFQIGSYTVSDKGAIKTAQNVSGSQAFQYCGGSALWGLV